MYLNEKDSLLIENVIFRLLSNSNASVSNTIDSETLSKVGVLYYKMKYEKFCITNNIPLGALPLEDFIEACDK